MKGYVRGLVSILQDVKNERNYKIKYDEKVHNEKKKRDEIMEKEFSEKIAALGIPSEVYRLREEASGSNLED